MLNKAEEIFVLFCKHLKNELSDAEKKTLHELIEGSEDVQRIFEKINSDEEFMRRLGSYYAKASNISDDEVREVFNRTIESTKIVEINYTKKPYFKWMAAASILLAAMLSYFMFFNYKKTSKDPIVRSQLLTNDVAPGSYKAKLTLADGSMIILDSAALGQLAKQGNTIITNKDGQLLYDISKSGTAMSGHNTLTTSIGESYAVVLADGSKVWLNSGSSIRYPVAFAGNDRPVEVTGEAFFEVAKDIKRPFRVRVNTLAGKACEVEVLGTQFNVMAYTDEPRIQTTLLEGAIVITNTKDNAKKLLTPGQQAAIDIDANMQVLSNVNTEVVAAWKDQTFYFKNYDLKTIMRQLARWYGVDVAFEGALPDRTYTGMVGKNTNLSEVLKILEQMDLRFRIEGKMVIVLP